MSSGVAAKPHNKTVNRREAETKEETKIAARSCRQRGTRPASVSRYPVRVVAGDVAQAVHERWRAERMRYARGYAPAHPCLVTRGDAGSVHAGRRGEVVLHGVDCDEEGQG